VNGKREWKPLGTDASLAAVALQRKRIEVERGESSDPVQLESPAPQQLPTTTAKASGDQNYLLTRICEYIQETAEQKSKRTLAAYSTALQQFLESLDTGKKQSKKHTLREYLNDPGLLGDVVRQKNIDDITRADILAFKLWMKGRGHEPRTISNRVKNLRTFLYHFSLPWPLTREDMPRFTKKTVRAYNQVELQKMFDVATVDEADLLHFLLCTGTREQEAQFACWPDVDLVAKTYTVTEHIDLGYRPKDSEEGTIHIADALVDRLTARRKRHPKSRLIFPAADGRPNGHALRIIKRLALQAGVNCGHCVNKAGFSCTTHPVCKHVILHKLRKTYATWLHKNGVPARTIMRFLRHSDLDTTLRYLADDEDEQTVAQINHAFGPFARRDNSAS
jgi:integrase